MTEHAPIAAATVIVVMFALLVMAHRIVYRHIAYWRAPLWVTSIAVVSVTMGPSVIAILGISWLFQVGVFAP